MDHAALVTTLFAFLATAPASAASAAPSSMPAIPDDLLGQLQPPVSLENVRAEVDDGQIGVYFDLAGVGDVSVAVLEEDKDAGRGLVMVDDVIVTEVVVDDDAVVRETSDFSALSPAQALTLAAGLVQVWHEDAVTQALEERDLKCTLAGKIAGATIGVAVFSGCGLVTKGPQCWGYGLSTHNAISKLITNKCNGAQNQ